MKKQKAVIVKSTDDKTWAYPSAAILPEELNGLLDQGWHVVMATAMSGTGLGGNTFSLVILEKRDE